MKTRFIYFLPLLLILFGCSSDDLVIIKVPVLENVTHEVLLFEFTPDTGNNSLRLRYEIQFNNPNDVTIHGFHKITTNSDGLVMSTLATDSSPCYEIAANSSCIISFDEEDSFDIGTVSSIELVSVEYNLEN